jgi:hypothetical protein
MRDAQRLLGVRGMQVYCLECPASAQVRADYPAASTWIGRLTAALFR